MKIKPIVLYSSLVLSIALMLFYFVKTNKLQNELLEEQNNKRALSEKVDHFEQLARIDEMLLNGEYTTAIASYNSSIKQLKENKMKIPLRIALAEKLLQKENTDNFDQTVKQVDTDSIHSEQAEDQNMIRVMDSLQFALKKSKVQVSYLKNQLREHTNGAYLSFKSVKGNTMHYVGEVKNGKANGYGIALLDSGSRYEGYWKNNKREGDGTFYWPDGEYYVGTYNSDRRSGYGTYFWPNGEKYAGEWKEDKRNGKGRFIGSDGDVIAGGEWDNDKLVEVNER